MKIECILKRKDGTKVHFGRAEHDNIVEYHFKPDAEGRHVTEVTDPDHIGAFLSIKEGYRLASEEAKPVNNQHGYGAADDGFDKLDRVALAELYKAKFGDFPSASFSKPKIIEALRQQEA